MSQYSNFGYNWNKWKKESESGRNISPTQISNNNSSVRVKGGNTKLSDNIFEPLCESLVDCSKLIYNLLKKSLGLNTYDFKKFFKEVKLCNESKEYPIFKNYNFDENSQTYIFKVPIGISVNDFKKIDDKIAHFLGRDEDDLRISRINYDIEVKVITSIPKVVYDQDIHKMKGFKIPIGIDLDTLNLRYWDLSDPANANGYAAGTTRCGKSNLIRLISTMLIKKSVADVQISWINIKKVDGKEFENCKNVIHYTENEEDANDILVKNYEEMKRRYTLFSKHKGVKTIWDYRDKINKMPVRVIIIEEIAGFEHDNEFHKTLRLIAQQGAGAGVLLLVATQLPNKDVMPNLTKQNINTVFGGKCKDSIRSDIIIEDGELHKLKGKGHFKIFDCDNYGTEIQVLWIDDEVVEEITHQNQKKDIRKNKRADVAATTTTLGDNKNFGQ